MSSFTFACLLFLSKYKRGRRPINDRHVIVTLDPKKFAEMEQRCLHIGNLQSFTPSITLHNRVMTPRLWYDERQHIDTDTVTPSRRCLSIPPGTKAFLYYFTSQQRPRIAGELRSELYQVMILHLLRASLTSWDSTVRYGRIHFTCSQNIIFLCMKNWRKNTICSTRLGRSFIDFCSNGAQISTSLYIDFSNHSTAFIIITKQSVEALQFGGLFLDDRHESKRPPYTCAYTNHHTPILLDWWLMLMYL